MSRNGKYDQFNFRPAGPNLCNFYGQYIGFGGGNGGASDGVTVTNSALFSAVDQSLFRTQLAGSNTVWTFSSWVYKCKSRNQVFLNCGTGGSQGQLGWNASDQFYIYNGSTVVGLTTGQFRDIGWYHIHVAYNTGESGTDKVKLSINGALVTAWSTDNRSSAGGFQDMNQGGSEIRLGNNKDDSGTIALDGYMAETVILDNTASAATNFGSYDITQGDYWRPKSTEDITALTLGTNGFYLPYSNSTYLGLTSGTTATVIKKGASGDYQNSSNASFSGSDISRTSAGSYGGTRLSTSFSGDFEVSFFFDATPSEQTVAGLYPTSSDGDFNGAVNGGGVTATVGVRNRFDALFFDGSSSNSVSRTNAVIKFRRVGSTISIIQGATTHQTQTSSAELRFYVLFWDDSGAHTIKDIFFQNSSDINFVAGGSPTQDGLTPTNISGLINPLNPNVATLSNGNKKVTSTGTSDQTNGISMLPCTGKVYFEFEYTTVGTNPSAGIVETSQASLFDDYVGGNNYSWGWHLVDGDLFNGGSVSASTPGTLAVNTRGCIAFDTATGKLWTGQLSGSTITWDNSGDPAAGSNPITSSIPTSTTWSVAVSGRNSCAISLFTTSTDFEASNIPSAYKAVNLSNFSSPSESDAFEYFEAKLYTGTGSEIDLDTTNAFQPDFCWIKSRSDAHANWITDSCRGATASLFTNGTSAEQTQAQLVKSFDSDGVTLGTYSQINTSSDNYVAWMIKAGGAPSATNSAGAGNTPTAGSVKIDGSNLGSGLAGSIPVTKLTANTKLGFSIGTYTGTGSAGTIAHGLGVVPEMVIVKKRAGDDTSSWAIYHSGLDASAPEDKYILLDAQSAVADLDGMWNDTAPTTSVFSVKDTQSTNESSDTYVFYCFAPSPFISIGGYEGNAAADGAFVPTIGSSGVPIQPVFHLTKDIDVVGPWVIADTSRSPYNPQANQLQPNLPNAEVTAYTTDIVTGGFKLTTSNSYTNGSSTFIYMAIGTPIISKSGDMLAGR